MNWVELGLERKTNEEKTEILLCQTLNNIANTCFKHLTTCLSEKDLKEMKELHLEEIKDFFIKILDRKVNRYFLNHCVHRKGSYYDQTTEISDTLAYAYSDEYYDDVNYEYGVTELPIEHENYNETNIDIKASSEKMVKIEASEKSLSNKTETSNGYENRTLKMVFVLCLGFILSVA